MSQQISNIQKLEYIFSHDEEQNLDQYDQVFTNLHQSAKKVEKNYLSFVNESKKTVDFCHNVQLKL